MDFNKKGQLCVVVYTKTIKGKPHPQGKTYRLLIPVEKYKG